MITYFMNYRISFLIAVIMTALLSGCIMLEIQDEPVPDPADAFVGTYDVTVQENVAWGFGRLSRTVKDEIVIMKLSPETVGMTGAFVGKGVVSDYTITFEPRYDSDSEGYLETTYPVAGVVDGKLWLSIEKDGYLRDPDSRQYFDFHALYSIKGIRKD